MKKHLSSLLYLLSAALFLAAAILIFTTDFAWPYFLMGGGALTMALAGIVQSRQNKD